MRLLSQEMWQISPIIIQTSINWANRILQQQKLRLANCMWQVMKFFYDPKIYIYVFLLGEVKRRESPYGQNAPVGSLPTVKMHPVGSLPTVKMHPVGSLTWMKILDFWPYKWILWVKKMTARDVYFSAQGVQDLCSEPLVCVCLSLHPLGWAHSFWRFIGASFFQIWTEIYWEG